MPVDKRIETPTLSPRDTLSRSGTLGARTEQLGSSARLVPSESLFVPIPAPAGPLLVVGIPAAVEPAPAGGDAGSGDAGPAGEGGGTSGGGEGGGTGDGGDF